VGSCLQVFLAPTRAGLRASEPPGHGPAGAPAPPRGHSPPPRRAGPPRRPRLFSSCS